MKDLTEEQETLITELLSGTLTRAKFSSMRSYARKVGDLERSIMLSEVFEVYKYRSKHAKERGEQSS